MKKFLVMTAAVLALTAVSALAEDAAPTPTPGAMMEKRGERIFERLDADKDGKVTKEEFLKVQEEHFAKMDANGDGVFTPDEAQAMKEKMRKMREMHGGQMGQPAPAPQPETAPAQ